MALLGPGTSQDLKQKMDPQAHLKSKGQSLGDNVEEFKEGPKRWVEEMMNEWYMNGIWMVYEWYMNGIWMVYEWYINGILMVY